MSGLYALENDEMYESDEAYDEAYGNDESDEASPSRVRRPMRVGPGRVASGKGLFRPRPVTNKFVTQAQLEAGLSRVGKQIQVNSDAIKKVSAQTTKITADLTSATNRLDKQVSEVKKEVKKQSEMTLLLTLLQKAPELEARPGADPEAANAVLGSVQVKKQSNLLPILLLSGSGGLGGGDSSNMLLLALALGGQL